MKIYSSKGADKGLVGAVNSSRGVHPSGVGAGEQSGLLERVAVATAWANTGETSLEVSTGGNPDDTTQWVLICGFSTSDTAAVDLVDSPNGELYDGPLGPEEGGLSTWLWVSGPGDLVFSSDGTAPFRVVTVTYRVTGGDPSRVVVFMDYEFRNNPGSDTIDMPGIAADSINDSKFVAVVGYGDGATGALSLPEGYQEVGLATQSQAPRGLLLERSGAVSTIDDTSGLLDGSTNSAVAVFHVIAGFA